MKIHNWILHQKDTKANDSNLKLWDLKNYLSMNINDFGSFPETKLTNKSVIFKGNFLQNASTIDEKSTLKILGSILGELHGRIIMVTQFGFIGWVDNNDWEFFSDKISNTLH